MTQQCDNTDQLDSERQCISPVRFQQSWKLIHSLQHFELGTEGKETTACVNHFPERKKLRVN